MVKGVVRVVLVAACAALMVPAAPVAAQDRACFGGSFGNLVAHTGEELAASFTGSGDPDFDVSVRIDWGDLTIDEQRVRGGATVEFEHSYDNEGQYTLDYSASGALDRDDDGNPVHCSEQETVTVTVIRPECHPLELSELSGGLDDWFVGFGPLQLGPGGNIAFTIDWGDGSDEVVLPPGFNGDFRGDTHDYAAAGVYEVHVAAEGFLSGTPEEVECENERTLVHVIDAADDGPPPPEDVEVLFGAERMATALAIAEEQFPDGAPAAVVARADIAPDALAGATLARALDAPLLLTRSDGVPTRVGTVLQELLGDGAEVTILGGTAALGPAVDEQLTAAGLTPRRVSGETRTETAVLIAEATLEAAADSEPAFILVADAFGFAEALVSGATAAAHGGAVVTTGPELSDASRAFLERFPDVPVFAVGSVAAQAVPSATAIVGSDVYATSRLVAERFYDDVDVVAVASGENFPDGLAGGPFAAARGAPLLLSAQATLPPVVEGYLEDVEPLQEVVVFGGSAALSADVVARLATYTG